MPQRFGLHEFVPERRSLPARIAGGAALAGAAALLYVLSRENYATFHTLIELVGVTITWSVALLLWNARRYQDIDAYLGLGYALFLSGVIDVLHTLSYRGVNVFGSPDGANLATQFWILARLVETMGWVGFAWAGRRQGVLAGSVIVLTLAAVGGVASILLWPVFPACFEPGRGLTSFKIIAEITMVVLLAGALVVYRRRSSGQDPQLVRRLSVALALVALAELLFTTYSDAYGVTNLLGHFIRIVSRFMLYLAFVDLAVSKPYARFFQRLQQEKTAIATSEERWRLLSQTNPDHILDLDEDLRIRFANYAAPGLTVDDLQGACILDFLPPERRDDVGATLRRALATGGPVSYETIYEGPEGQVIHYETMAMGGPGAEGEGRRLTLVARNVTDRKLTEAALAETERQMSGILANVPGMVFRCENDDDWTMRFCSEGCVDLTGYQVEDLVGNARMSYASLILPDDVDTVAEAVGDGLERHERYQVTYRIRRRDGTVTWVWEQGCGVFRDGALEHIEGFITDITAQVRAEEDRRAVEAKALKAQKFESLGVMAGGIAHDFNNLLQTMLGFAELAAADVGPQHQAAEPLEAVILAANKASELTRQMLAFAGHGTIEARDLDIAAELAGMAPLLAGAVPKSILFRREEGGELPLATVDAAQLHQVALNLVRNAAEAIGEESGTILLRTGRRTCTAADLAASVSGAHPDGSLPAPGEYVWLEVEDDGCGMDAATLARIFEPFFTTKFVGRGLGMAAVQGIVRGHRGALFIDTAPGRGTKVRALFPVHAGADKAAPEPVAAPVAELRRPVDGGAVLVVDDEADVRRMAELTLTAAGYRVIAAANGRDAVAVLAAARDGISAVLLDVVMPEMGGEECLDEIRRLEPEVPVVVMSGWTEQDLEQRFAGRSYQGLLAKPFSTERLLAEMGRVASGRGGA